jgi:hypothetical protein
MVGSLSTNKQEGALTRLEPRECQTRLFPMRLETRGGTHFNNLSLKFILNRSIMYTPINQWQHDYCNSFLDVSSTHVAISSQLGLGID